MGARIARNRVAQATAEVLADRLAADRETSGAARRSDTQRRRQGAAAGSRLVLLGTLLLLVGRGVGGRAPVARPAFAQPGPAPLPVYLPLALRAAADLPRPTPATSPAAPTTTPATAVPTSSATPTPIQPQPPIFGVQIGVQPYDRSAAEFASFLSALMDRLTTAGVGWLRVPVFWYAIEGRDATPPLRDWSFTDRTLGAVGQRGLSVMAVVYGHPAWAASRSCGPVDRVPLSRYGDFLTALVERYDGDGQDDAPGSPVVRAWEIGNEPDFAPGQAKGESDYGSCFGDDGGPSAYAEHLRVAAQAVHAASPEAQLVFGALAYERFYNAPAWYRTAHRGPFRYGFVREVLSQLAASHAGEPGWPFVDAFAVHNYNDFRDNWEANAASDEAVDRELVDKLARFRANELHPAGDAYEWASLPVLVSEVSMADSPSNQWIARSAEYQLAYIGQVMVRALAAGSGAAIWYLDQDYAVGDCGEPDAWQTFGLFRSLRVAREAARCPSNPLPGYRPASDLEAKPVLTALQTLSRQLQEATFDRLLTPQETGHWQVQAYRFRRPDGGYVLVAFADHGQPLGRKVAGVPVADPSHVLRVDRSMLPDWSGRTRLVDCLGAERTSSEDPVALTVDFRPVYISALPPASSAAVSPTEPAIPATRLPSAGRSALDELLAAATQLATSTATPRVVFASATPKGTAVSPAAVATSGPGAASVTAGRPASAPGSPNVGTAPGDVLAPGETATPDGLSAANPTGSQSGGDARAASQASPPGPEPPRTERGVRGRAEAEREPDAMGPAEARGSARATPWARRGLVHLPADEPGLRRMWTEYGSPWQGMTLAQRLTRGRPWAGGSLFAYGVLVALFCLAVLGVWRGMDPLAPTEAPSLACRQVPSEAPSPACRQAPSGEDVVDTPGKASGRIQP